MILSSSSTNYYNDRYNAIYPGYQDNLPYESWGEEGALDHFQLKTTYPTPQWEIIAGNLPEGIILDTQGRLSGTPVKQGVYTFTVSDGESTKELTFEIKPYRAQWYTNAKFGVMPQWGFFCEPRIIGSYLEDQSSIANKVQQFEARITGFNAQEWVDQSVELGAKVINMLVHGGDAWRLWPSTSPSQGEMKTQRNLVKEVIDEAHQQGLKFIAYFSPDKGWNPGNTDYAVYSTESNFDAWGTLNTGLCRELIDMGVDGLWIDVGGSPDLFSSVDPNWFNWEAVIKYARLHNPDCILLSNPGIRNGGNILQYPHTDVAIYEGEMNLQEASLVVANPSILDKKVGIESVMLLDSTWAWEPSKGIPHIPAKNPELIIEKIKENWKRGVTVMLNWPVHTDGTFIPEAYENALTIIGEFVRENNNFTQEVKTPVVENNIVEFPVEKGVRVFYNVNEGISNETDRVYTKPFTITPPSIINYKLKKDNLQLGDNNKLTIKNTESGLNLESKLESFFENVSGDVLINNTENPGIYRGMRIVVKQNNLFLHKIGRKATGEQRGKVIIRRYSDNYPVLIYEDILLEEDGYEYIHIPKIQLVAGQSYLIVFKEWRGFYKNDFQNLLENPYLRVVSNDHFSNINSNTSLNEIGDVKPIIQDKIGALLNLKYTIGDKKSNLALGAKVNFSGTLGVILEPSSGYHYAENAVDGDLETIAIAGGEYSYTLHIDLGTVRAINTIILKMSEEYFSTEFEIYSSVELNKGYVLKTSISNNSRAEFYFEYTPFYAQHLYIASKKPNAANQLGVQMGVRSLEVYG